MALTQKTDHVEESKSLLVDAVRVGKDGSPLTNTQGLVGVFAKRVQDLEDVLFQIINETTVDTATGATLDSIGRIVGQTRQGQDDDDYRQSIKSRIAINTGSGTVEEIITVVRSVAGDKAVQVTEFFPAGFEAEVTEPLDAETDGELIGRFVQEGKPAGVGAAFRWHETATPFQFATGDVVEIDASLGFGGGDLAGAFGDGGGS